MNPAVNRASMTVPTSLSIVLISGCRHFGHSGFVASQAVFLHDGNGSGGQFYGLRFEAECENGGVSQTVFGLERILTNQRRMGKVAIVARYIPTVRRMSMGNVGIRHDVTVHTRFRRIDHVRSHTGDVSQEQPHPAKATQEDQRGNSKFRANKAQPQNHNGEDKYNSDHLNHTWSLAGRYKKIKPPNGCCSHLPSGEAVSDSVGMRPAIVGGGYIPHGIRDRFRHVGNENPEK